MMSIVRRGRNNESRIGCLGNGLASRREWFSGGKIVPKYSSSDWEFLK